VPNPFAGDRTVRVSEVRGGRRIERQFEELPKQARDELRKGLNRVTADLAIRVRAAGRAESRQAARASSTVRASRGLRPFVVAGPHPLLFLSEFGMLRRTGWYAKGRYRNSKERQAKTWFPGHSYWFFRTQEHSDEMVATECRRIADEVISKWR